MKFVVVRTKQASAVMGRSDAIVLPRSFQKVRDSQDVVTVMSRIPSNTVDCCYIVGNAKLVLPQSNQDNEFLSCLAETLVKNKECLVVHHYFHKVGYSLPFLMMPSVDSECEETSLVMIQIASRLELSPTNGSHLMKKLEPSNRKENLMKTIENIMDTTTESSFYNPLDNKSLWKKLVRSALISKGIEDEKFATEKEQK